MKRLLLGVLALALLAAPARAQVSCTNVSTTCGGGGGAALGGDNTWTGTQTFLDTKFFVVDDGDLTKMLAFQVSGVAGGATRTLTIPNASGTLPLLSLAQSWTAFQLYLNGGGIVFGAASDTTGNQIALRTANTPDTTTLSTGSVSNLWVVAEAADAATDWAHPLQVHPSIFFQSANSGTITQYLGVSAHGIQTELFKTLTESAATSLVQIPVASGAATGGTITYTVFGADAVDQQARSSVIRFSASNKAGTETCGLSNNAGTADASITETEDGNASAISSGTLTYAITCSTAAANAIEIQINAVSSLTQTTLRAYYSLAIAGPGSPLLQ